MLEDKNWILYFLCEKTSSKWKEFCTVNKVSRFFSLISFGELKVDKKLNNTYSLLDELHQLILTEIWHAIVIPND